MARRRAEGGEERGAVVDEAIGRRGGRSVWLTAARSPARLAALAAAIAYLLGVSWYLLSHGGWPTVDYLVPPLLLLAIVLGRGWAFVLDWGPFLLLVLAWQATAGIADELGRPVHVGSLADADRWLFRGQVPVVELQRRLFDPARPSWFDWAATIQHALHFVLPVAVGLALWLRSRRLYWRYLASVLVLFFLGFAVYALYPAAPPWMAGLQGEIPLVHRVAVETVLQLPSSAPVGLAYTHFSPNQVAAMPSLHAALPLLLALVLVRVWGRWLALALLYPATMGFNLVYLGEHWVIDVLAGYVLALISYALVWVLPEALAWRPAVRLPRLSPAPALRRVGSLSLPALAVFSVAVIALSLRPGRPSGDGPVIPGLQVQAGEPRQILTPVPCDLGASPSTALDELLAPVAGRYAVYLFDVEDGACHVLTANVSFPPPREQRAPALARRAPFGPASVERLALEVQVAALRTGPPAGLVIEAGLPAERQYLIVVELAEAPDLDAVTAAVDQLTAMVLSAPGGG